MRIHPLTAIKPKGAPRFGDTVVKPPKDLNLNNPTDPEVIRAFIYRFQQGSKLLVPLCAGGPVVVSDVTYNNGSKMIISNPFARFVPINRLEPEQIVLYSLPPVTLPGDPQWKQNKEQNEAKLATLIELNRSLLGNPRVTPQSLWQEQFNQVVDKALKDTPAMAFKLVRRKQDVVQPIAYTMDGDLVLVKNPNWTPGRIYTAKPLDGYELNRSLPKALWPKVEKQPKGYQVQLLFASPQDLTPITSDFTGENAAFIPKTTDEA